MSTPLDRGPRLRVGSVPYLVGRPLDLGLEAEAGIEFTQRVPARLVEDLRSGALDVALVSSIELFRRPGYRWLDGLAVAGKGFVASVQVFLRRPIEDVRTLALDPSSRAAATLVQVLLNDPTLARDPVQFLEVAPGEDPRLAAADAWLRIGDAALREYLAPGAPPVWNPAQAWTERTGLCFPFAVWIVREGVELSVEQRAAFARARERGARALDTLAHQASRAWSLPLEACRKYLREECRYQPGPELAPALQLFRDSAARVGLARAEFSPTAIAMEIMHVA